MLITSQFWKQFFEASANVSLSGYEETPLDPDDATITTTNDTSTSQDLTTPSSSTCPSPHADLTSTPSHNPAHHDNSTPSSPFYSPGTHSTPRAPHPHQPSLATYSSPYETLRRETLGPPTQTPPHSPSPSHSATDLPSTPRNPYHAEDPQSSPFLPPSTAATHNPNAARTPANDLLLHRVLDKNYRLQATPHTQSRLPRYNVGATPPPPRGTARREYPRTRSALPEDPDSSPIAPLPEIRTHMFSPAKGKRVPGVSVLTPAKKKAAAGPGTDAARTHAIWDSDSDSDGLPAGMSPPKTMHFYIPQSKLLKTPGMSPPALPPFRTQKRRLGSWDGYVRT